LSLAQVWNFWQQGTSDPDSALLAQARKGSRSAFDALRRQHEQSLRGFVARRVGAEGCDDLTQDIWLACWQALPKYAGRARFKAWLYGIATHKCADYLRARAQHARRQETAELTDIAAPDAYSALELRQAVQEALRLLPNEQREVLELYYYAELTLAEIAQTLSRNLNTVKYQFYRAHAQVGKELQTEEHSTP
jgi:RNA polymerase sigma-70 factor (ECF subfamily)